MNHNWLDTKVKDLTIEDALEAHRDGIDFVCGDGHLIQLVSEPPVRLRNVILRRDGKKHNE